MGAAAATSNSDPASDRKVAFSDAPGDKKLNQIGAQLPMIEVSEEVVMLIYSNAKSKLPARIEKWAPWLTLRRVESDERGNRATSLPHRHTKVTEKARSRADPCWPPRHSQDETSNHVESLVQWY